MWMCAIPLTPSLDVKAHLDRPMTSARNMKLLVRSAVRAAASGTLHLAPTSLWSRVFPKTELGVCYHIVSDVPVPHVRHYPILGTAAFESDLSYLKARFGFVSYQQLVERRSSGAVRDNSVILTFDDGFAECADVIAPILLSHGVSATFFVITDLIDNTVIFRESAASLCIEKILQTPIERVETIIGELGLDARLQPPAPRFWLDPTRPPLDIADLGQQPDARLRPLLHWLLTVEPTEAGLVDQLAACLGVDPHSYLLETKPYLSTQQIQQLKADGFTIGAHSCSHRRLQDLPLAAAEHEVVESCRVIHAITGQDSVPFAFPYYGAGLDRAWLGRLREQHDFIGLFFDTDGLREDDPIVVQRVFGERFGDDRTMDAILRRAWARRPAWRRSRQTGSGPAGERQPQRAVTS
jgi:peptidoglycan/xylan/chitin deacetylase (PgdA/CDA1 family)